MTLLNIFPIKLMYYKYKLNSFLIPRAPNATYMLQEIHMHIAIHILNKILQYVCFGILHIQLDLYTEKNYYSTLYHCPA